VASRARLGHRRRNQRGELFCPTAGNRRNQAMVDAGADLCLAFIHPRSRGATHCAVTAIHAGITTSVFHTD
jgi:hypothetical protein